MIYRLSRNTDCHSGLIIIIMSGPNKLCPCSLVFQVWLLGKEEPSNWCSGLAISLGDCDWLIFLLLWGGASKSYWRPPAITGHSSGWHHPVLTGQCEKYIYFHMSQTQWNFIFLNITRFLSPNFTLTRNIITFGSHRI